ncbi:MAG: hypothetical protein OEM60_09375 [Gammaproteobacteria bacterium]|nr:hypothetical protein [Gammaproteobacteria bacterium]MDH3429339.1 hypothetical protein [Gammaproteobacteria bacterium]MDH3434056.1 hypothetical protein [Gammaproteobacteria bacterium]
MKKLAYFLLVAGFLVGAYATALDARDVDWMLFGAAAAAAIAGVLIAKRQDSATARSESVLETNRGELNESIANVVKDLTQMTDGVAAQGTQLRDWIDDQLRPDLRRFAEARESMVHLFGLQTYADIMSHFAAGERYINRVWSASADGYDAEAEQYLSKAAEQFRHAQSQLSAAAS